MFCRRTSGQSLGLVRHHESVNRPVIVYRNMLHHQGPSGPPLRALCIALLTAAGAWAQATPVITSVVNSYSFVPQVSPRGLASIQGSNLDNATQNGPGTSKVFVNGISALIKQTTKGARSEEHTSELQSQFDL